MNYDELIARDPKDLRLLAAQYGIKVGGRMKPENIAKLIFEFVQNKPKQDSMKHVAEQPKAPAVIHSEEEVRNALKHLEAKPQFGMTFPGDDTVIFKCRGAEESIHLSSPLRVIHSKADSVSRGALLPRAILDNKTNPTENSGKIMMI